MKIFLQWKVNRNLSQPPNSYGQAMQQRLRFRPPGGDLKGLFVVRTAPAMFLALCGIFSAATLRNSQSNKTTQTESIGMIPGQQAPAFMLGDQFDSMQSNATLKGPRGTVLLFVRSADW